MDVPNDVFIPNSLQLIYLKCLLDLFRGGLDEPQPQIAAEYQMQLLNLGWIEAAEGNRVRITKKGIKQLDSFLLGTHKE